MKKLLIRLLCLLLVIVTVFPLVVSCKDNEKDKDKDKDKDGDNDNKTEESNPVEPYIGMVQTGVNEKSILDPRSSDLLSRNPRLVVNSSRGKNAIVYKIEQNALTVNLPQSVDIAQYYRVEFSVYNETPSDTIVTIKLGNCKTAQKIRLDFAGWQDYSIQLDKFSVENPYPLIPQVIFTYSEGALGAEILISEIKAVMPVYEMQVPEGVDINDEALYSSIIERYRTYLVGTEQESYSAEHLENANDIADTCTPIWQEFKATYNNGAPNSLFGYVLSEDRNGEPYYFEAKGKYLYYNLLDMTKAYATPGCSYYKNAELLEDIKRGLEYGYNNIYGAYIVQTGKTFGNWWEWDIAIPDSLTRMLTMLESELDRNTILKYLEPVDILRPIPEGSAANKLAMTAISVLAGAFERDAEKILLARELTNDVFTLIDELPADAPRTNDDGGFFSDGSFIQHDASPLAGQYGAVLLGDSAKLMYILQDSPFAFKDEITEIHYFWMFEGFSPLIFGKNFTGSVSGRSLDYYQSENSVFLGIVSHLAVMQTYAPEPTKSELQSLLRAYMVQSDDSFYYSMPIFLIDYAVQLKDNSQIALPAAYEKTLVYGNMDRVMHHGAEYGVALSLSSTRIYKYESINTDNETGWYHGDGMIYLYTGGYDYSWEHFWYANPYLMGGTTVNLAQRNAVCITPSPYGTSPYAGGVQQGKYGIAGYQAGSQYDNGTYVVRLTYNDQKDSNLTANKSYFFFDNEVVCIGSNIKDYSGADVVTVVENRLWKDGDVLSINGVAVAPATVQTTIAARTMHFTGMGGYVFGNTATQNAISYQKATNLIQPTFGNRSVNDDEGFAETFKNTTRDFLEITVNHGTSLDGTLTNNKYFYTYLPGATSEETESYSADPDIKLIKHTADVHAVVETKLGIVACNVFNEGEAEITVDNSATDVTEIIAYTPLSLMISKNGDGSYLISVSDPTQLYRNTSLEITIEGISGVVSADAGVNASVADGTVSIHVNSKDANGATYNITVK